MSSKELSYNLHDADLLWIGGFSKCGGSQNVNRPEGVDNSQHIGYGDKKFRWSNLSICDVLIYIECWKSEAYRVIRQIDKTRFAGANPVHHY